MVEGAYDGYVDERQIEYEAGRILCEQKEVKALEVSASNMHFAVMTNPKKEVVFAMDKPARCDCAAYYNWGECRHIVAATLMAEKIGILKEFKKKKAYENGPDLLQAMEDALPTGEPLQLEVTLFLQREKGENICRAGLRIGQERFYVIRSIDEFLQAKKTQRPLAFGKGFVYQPSWMSFSKADEKILEVFDYLYQGDQRKNGQGRIALLPDSYVHLLLSRLRSNTFRIAVGENIHKVRGIEKSEIPLFYQVLRQPQGINISAKWVEQMFAITQDGKYLLVEDRVIYAAKKQRKILPVLLKNAMKNQADFFFSFDQTTRIISEVIPWLSLSGVVQVDPFLKENVIDRPLVPKIYLDKEGKRIVAKVEYMYGDKSVFPFSQDESTQKKGQQLIIRDMKKEHQILEELEKFNFHVGKKHIYLQGDEDVFYFLTEGVCKLSQISQVFASNQFKKMAPRKPMLRVEMALKANRLNLSFFEEEEPTQEILEIFEALQQKKDYFRLKDGSFLDLSDLEPWQEVAEEVLDYAKQTGQRQPGDHTLSVSAYKTLYLNTLLEHVDGQVKVEKQTKAEIAAFSQGGKEEIPKGLQAELRGYQKKGLCWLQAIWSLKMGGVLADEMGLGKTLQVIALLLWLKETGKLDQPAIVITPTSLCYNWQAEINRYAPGLKVALLHGAQSARMAQIEKMEKGQNEVDVLITSYPILRRDIDYLEKRHYAVVVIDEAQHIKNPGSIGTNAVKRLEGNVRLALTGTPMENHIGELWSVMDFAMPGYLASYGQFMRKYNEEKQLEKLREKITPFLLRRLKKEVLQELPDKIETTLMAQMPIEQDRAYRAALLRLRGRINDLLEGDGFDRGKIEVLAAITELRQMCCHPALLLPEYSGSSGKLDLLMDILPPMIENGHRILLFSQFTTMLKIIKRNLEAQGIECVYLDGNTKAEKRLELADEFNQGYGRVFLISLKAGGTGLNLIGADTVIHYDPWWNPAVEDQATDRAHRIGQKKKVEVLRLLTHNSIEEQVAKLGEKKKEIFDQLITAAEQMPTALTKEEVKALFA